MSQSKPAFSCQTCGAGLIFDEEKQKLKCGHCQRFYDVSSFPFSPQKTDNAFSYCRFACTGCAQYQSSLLEIDSWQVLAQVMSILSILFCLIGGPVWYYMVKALHESQQNTLDRYLCDYAQNNRL